MDYNVELFAGDGFLLTRNNSHHYTLRFDTENKNILLSNIIDFPLVKLIYDLNTDIYEKVIFNKTSENEGNLIILVKHFFQDIGLPQRYAHVNIKKCVTEEKIVFDLYTIKNQMPIEIPDDVILLDIEKLTINCILITPHKVNICANIHVASDLDIPIFYEKMVGKIIYKIFNRLKQFIENVCI